METILQETAAYVGKLEAQIQLSNNEKAVICEEISENAVPLTNLDDVCADLEKQMLDIEAYTSDNSANPELETALKQTASLEGEFINIFSLELAKLKKVSDTGNEVMYEEMAGGETKARIADDLQSDIQTPQSSVAILAAAFDSEIARIQALLKAERLSNDLLSKSQADLKTELDEQTFENQQLSASLIKTKEESRLLSEEIITLKVIISLCMI